jgi:hypothetical protein
MNTLIIEKTGNFWIDNGIVALYKVLRELGCNVDLGASVLVVTSEKNEGKNIEEMLNKAKDKVVKSYLKQTNGVGWIYRENNFEVYQKTDFKMHLKPFFTGKTPKTEGALFTMDSKDNELGANGKKMTIEEQHEFLIFKDKMSPVMIGDKKVPLSNKGFLNNPPKYEIGKTFSCTFMNSGMKLCSFSGRRYQKADVVTGMNYPFLTGKSGELNFASQLNVKPAISELYDFVSLFSFLNLNYLLQGDLKHYFELYDGNMKDLESFYNVIEPNMDNINPARRDYCSFENQIIGTQYESESFFNFLLSVYAQVNQRIQKDKRKGVLLKKSVYTLSNDGNIFRDVKEYTSISTLFDLFDSFENQEGDELNYREPFFNFIRYFYKSLDGGKHDTTWRNRICSDILSFRSILKTVELFMGEVKMREKDGKGGILFLDRIIEIYNFKTQRDMKAEMVDICKAVGNRIGAYCRKEDDKGILFSIRNAKSRIEFLNVLAETQFRTEVSYGETFFKELPDNAQWEEYKALVSIFAMNSFLYKEKKQADSNNN